MTFYGLPDCKSPYLVLQGLFLMAIFFLYTPIAPEFL